MNSVLALILASATISVAAGANLGYSEADSCSPTKWKLFKQQYSRNKLNADPAQDRVRQAIFCKSLRAIEEHNSNPNVTYKMGLNQFSDRTEEELKQLTGGLSVKNIIQEDNSAEILKKLSKFINLNEEPPAKVDWSLDASRVSPAKDQGDCGSCWAFATVGLLEGQEKPANGSKLVPLSEQNLVDCDTMNYACNGGWFTVAFDEIKRNGGVMTQADYPYVSGESKTRETCKMDAKKAFRSTVNLGETLMLIPGNETLLKQVVASYGPVVAAIETTDSFLAYEKGIFYAKRCRTRITHAILIVGYGRDEEQGLDYWKIKNSWSDEWGQKGFGLMSRNRRSNCFIADYNFIILPNLSQ